MVPRCRVRLHRLSPTTSIRTQRTARSRPRRPRWRRPSVRHRRRHHSADCASGGQMVFFIYAMPRAGSHAPSAGAELVHSTTQPSCTRETVDWWASHHHGGVVLARWNMFMRRAAHTMASGIIGQRHLRQRYASSRARSSSSNRVADVRKRAVVDLRSARHRTLCGSARLSLVLRRHRVLYEP